MKKISKVATASVLLFTLANPLGVLAENNVENISATSNNKLTQDITIQAKEVNGGIVFEVTAAKDTYNTVIHATINGQKFTYNLGNLKKGQVSKVVQPDVSVNRKDVNTNKKDAAISRENRTEKSLPNTSVVRELIEKTVSYNTELNGNVIEANVVYKTYELVEKKDEKATEKEVMPEVAKPAAPTPKVEQPKAEQPEAAKPATPKAETPVESTEAKATEPEVTKPATPKAETPVESTETKATEPEVTKPATPKAETPVESTEAKATEPEVVKPATPKAEAPTESTEAKATEPEVVKPVTPKAEAPAESTEAKATEPEAAKPATPKAEAPTESAEGKGTEPEAAKPAPNEAGTTAGDEGKEAKETEESETNATPKENAIEGTGSEGVTPGATTEEGTSEATPGVTGTEANPAPKENVTEGTGSEVKPAPNEAGTSEATGTEVKPAPNEEGTTAGDEGKEAKETEESETNAAPKENATEAGTEANPTVKEDAPEGTVSEETTGTEVKPAPKEIEENTEEIKQDEELKAFILEEIDNIITGEDGIATSKLKEIDKIQDEEKKAELKDKLKKLTDEAEIEIKKAKDNEEAISITERYRDMIDAIEVPGEKYTKPNYSKDNLSTGRNDGTTIEGGSTSIGHGSGEAPSGATQPESSASTGGATESPQAQPAATETTSDSTPTAQPTAESPATTTTESATSTQPATGTNSDSTVTDQPQPAATSETATAGTSSFRRAGEYQARARRVARAANQPDGTVNISYNYDGMPDINGFLSDPRENNTVAIPNSATEEKAKELVKEKIQAKVKELAKYGYTVKEEIIFEQDTNVKNFNYVVTFTKEKTGTTGFRIAPEVQVRAKKVVKRDLSNKTKQINIYYNLTALKDIAGALGNVGENNLLTLPGNATKEEIKKAIEEKTKSQIEQLNKQGFKVTSTTDLDQIVEGGDSYDYVIEFTKETKAQSVGNTGFRKAPLVQKRAKRSAEVQETVDVNIYFNLKTLPGIAGALDVDGDTTIKLPKNATVEQVKAAIQGKIAKVEKRGYKVSDFYFGAKTERGYDFVVEFKK